MTAPIPSRFELSSTEVGAACRQWTHCFQQPSLERFAVAGELRYTESLGLNRMLHPTDKMCYLLSLTLDL